MAFDKFQRTRESLTTFDLGATAVTGSSDQGERAYAEKFMWSAAEKLLKSYEHDSGSKASHTMWTAVRERNRDQVQMLIDGIRMLCRPSFSLTHTERGFARIDFRDKSGQPCSMQESSSADEACIWLGVHARTDLNTGVPMADSQNFRMHLTRQQVEELIPLLQHFVKTGKVEVPR